MEKKFLFGGIITSALFLTSPVNAIEYDTYVSGKLSISKINTDNNVNLIYNKVYPMSKEIHTDNVLGLKIASGISIPNKYGNIRGELELAWNGKSKDSNKFDVTITSTFNSVFYSTTSIYTALANIYYDFDTNTKFNPYVGFGIGYARAEVSAAGVNSLNNISSESKENNLALNFNLGVSYKYSDKISLDVSYRYSDYGNIENTVATNIANLSSDSYSKGKFKLSSNDITFAVRYLF